MGVGGSVGVVVMSPLCWRHDCGERAGKDRRFGWVVVVVVGERRRRLRRRRVSVDESRWPHERRGRRVLCVRRVGCPRPACENFLPDIAMYDLQAALYLSVWISPHQAQSTLPYVAPAGSHLLPSPANPDAPHRRRVCSSCSPTRIRTRTPSGIAASTRSGKASPMETDSSTLCRWASWCVPQPHHSSSP